MNARDIGFIRVHVGDSYLLSKAYRALAASVDVGTCEISEAGMQRFRQILAEVENCSDYAAVPAPAVSGVWSGRGA